MNIYKRKQQLKFLLFLFAVAIGVSSLFYTHNLVQILSEEERKKVELWAEATKQLADPNEVDMDISFLIQVIQYNTTVPVLLVNDEGEIVGHRNFDSTRIQNPLYLERQYAKLKVETEPILVDLGDDKNYIYYKNSIILNRLTYYPYIQLGVILLFILVSYFAFSVSRKAEQNKVWVGLSKETAHQLGTPTSSLIAWVELLKLKKVDHDVVVELEKDASRLEKITARFSKIGSKPRLKPHNIIDVINKSLDYLRVRISERVKLEINHTENEIFAPIDLELFEWVIENVCKNALDAIDGKGHIMLSLTKNTKHCYIDISDTGKGIHKSKFKTIFKPGYTTKDRGWGLGLSLTKRIIENYHDGKIYVSYSEIGKGTNIRIILNL